MRNEERIIGYTGEHNGDWHTVIARENDGRTQYKICPALGRVHPHMNEWLDECPPIEKPAGQHKSKTRETR